MKKVFISGSIDIKKLDELVINSLSKIISQNIQVLVGDASGVDTLVQKYLFSCNYFNVIVYTIFQKPRNLLSTNFQVKRIDIKNLLGRKAQEKKDEAMTRDSDYSFVIWNGKSKGSFNNILRAIENNKKLKVYYTDKKRFLEKEELKVEDIKKIYYKHNGLGLKELAKQTNQSLAYIKEIAKNYPQFKIISHYKGKEQVKYSIDFINILSGQNLLFKLRK